MKTNVPMYRACDNEFFFSHKGKDHLVKMPEQFEKTFYGKIPITINLSSENEVEEYDFSVYDQLLEYRYIAKSNNDHEVMIFINGKQNIKDFITVYVANNNLKAEGFAIFKITAHGCCGRCDIFFDDDILEVL